MILNEQQEMIRDAAARFAEERLAPNSREWETQARVDMQVLREMGELGFMGMTVPEQWNGAGLDYVSYALALMEIASGDGAVSTFAQFCKVPAATC
jgi:butyryl-CoA dehydrogenase